MTENTERFTPNSSEVNPVYPGKSGIRNCFVTLDDTDIGMIAAAVMRRSHANAGKEPPPPNFVHFFDEVDEWYDSMFELFSNAAAGEVALTGYDLRKIRDDIMSAEMSGVHKAMHALITGENPKLALPYLEQGQRLNGVSLKLCKVRRPDKENVR